MIPSHLFCIDNTRDLPIKRSEYFVIMSAENEEIQLNMDIEICDDSDSDSGDSDDDDNGEIGEVEREEEEDLGGGGYFRNQLPQAYQHEPLLRSARSRSERAASLTLTNTEVSLHLH